jgi:hypothetical protein
VKCAPTTSFVSKTTGQFHECIQEGALEERLGAVIGAQHGVGDYGMGNAMKPRRAT